MTTQYNSKHLNNMNKQIEKMSKTEHLQILNIIIQNDKIKVTENNNGCFINLNELQESTLDAIDKFLAYSSTKEKELKSIEKETCKMENMLS